MTPYNDELAFGSFTRALRSSSANAVTGDNLAGGALGYSRKLGIRFGPDLALWATGGFAWGAAEGVMFQTLTTELDTIAFTVGARARMALHRRVVVNGRLDLGTARTSLSLQDTMGHSAADSSWGGVTTASLALDLLAASSRRFALGLRVELGYTFTTAVQLTATSSRGDEDTIELPNNEASLGRLDLGGRFFGMSVISQF